MCNDVDLVEIQLVFNSLCPHYCIAGAACMLAEDCLNYIYNYSAQPYTAKNLQYVSHLSSINIIPRHVQYYPHKKISKRMSDGC